MSKRLGAKVKSKHLAKSVVVFYELKLHIPRKKMVIPRAKTFTDVQVMLFIFIEVWDFVR